MDPTETTKSLLASSQACAEKAAKSAVEPGVLAAASAAYAAAAKDLAEAAVTIANTFSIGSLE